MYRDQLKSVCQTFISVFMLVLFLASGNLVAGEREDWRVRTGLDVFASLLAADQDIAKKQGPDGKLLLILMYSDKKERAEDMARDLMRIGNISKIPIRVETAASLTGYEKVPVAGVFLTQKVTHEFGAVMRYGIKHRIIIFSPFQGDVERGASGGILISDRILPYLNLETMHLSDIRIKPFFLRIAETP